ncbi:MAG: enoyl-CoA hydratase [Deltaproteobacteria bacterium]|nr:MAG: enoyl-CoA hydratase [Deltaproteobacteria bacterium]
MDGEVHCPAGKIMIQEEEMSVRLNIEKGVAYITLAAPEKLNAYDLEMAKSLFEAVLRAEDDGEVRCIVITGEGRAFSAGGDVKFFKRIVSGEERGAEEVLLYLHGTVATLRRMGKPVISAVNGVAAGAGIGIALSADLVYASREASFVFAYPRVGLSPDGGTTFLLTREIGYHRTMELLLTGKVLGAEEALSWGLVNGVKEPEELLPFVSSLAGKIAGGPTGAYARGKELIAQAYFGAMETQMERERQNIKESMKTDDFREGVLSFIEKREPRFTGK